MARFERKLTSGLSIRNKQQNSTQFGCNRIGFTLNIQRKRRLQWFIQRLILYLTSQYCIMETFLQW